MPTATGFVKSGARPNSTSTGNTSDALNSVLPGFSDLSGGATGVIANLLKGLPNPATAQQATATFGVNSGLGTGSGFLQGIGYDLYNQQGQAMQQQGLDDLLKTIGTYSGNVVANAPQTFQNQQAGAQLGEQANEFSQTYQLQKFQAMLQALGLGNNISNGGQVNMPQMSL